MGKDLFGAIISSRHVNSYKNHATDLASYIEKFRFLWLFSMSDFNIKKRTRAQYKSIQV